MIYGRHRERAHTDDERLLIDEEVGAVVRGGLRQILIARDDAEDEVVLPRGISPGFRRSPRRRA
jgi:hypothetical protein